MINSKEKAGRTTQEDVKYFLMYLLRQADSNGLLSRSQKILAREAKINVEITSVIQELEFYKPSVGREFKTLTFKIVTDEMAEKIYKRHIEKQVRHEKIPTKSTSEDSQRLIRIEEMLIKLSSQLS